MLRLTPSDVAVTITVCVPEAFRGVLPLVVPLPDEVTPAQPKASAMTKATPTASPDSDHAGYARPGSTNTTQLRPRFSGEANISDGGDWYSDVAMKAFKFLQAREIQNKELVIDRQATHVADPSPPHSPGVFIRPETPDTADGSAPFF